MVFMYVYVCVNKHSSPSSVRAKGEFKIPRHGAQNLVLSVSPSTYTLPVDPTDNRVSCELKHYVPIIILSGSDLLARKADEYLPSKASILLLKSSSVNTFITIHLS